ncbi:MAG: hypothetical protein A2Y20_10420 [Firmicutes bacterium GWF2_51_9]|nr:MAG: hypothetical protein A2Y20_10420 [Firmicutes bacterium GWF2_51_9]
MTFQKEFSLKDIFEICNNDSEKVFLSRFFKSREEINAYVELYYAISSSEVDSKKKRSLLTFLSTRYYWVFYELKNLLWNHSTCDLDDVCKTIFQKIDMQLLTEIDWQELYKKLKTPHYKSLRISASHYKIKDAYEDKLLFKNIIDSITENIEDSLVLEFDDENHCVYSFDGSGYFLLSEMHMQLKKAGEPTIVYSNDIQLLIDLNGICTLVITRLLNSLSKQNENM